MMLTCPIGLVDIVLLALVYRERSHRSEHLAAGNAMSDVISSGMQC